MSLFASVLVLRMMSCCHIRAVTSSQWSRNLKVNVTKCILKKNGLRKKYELSTNACSVNINWQSWNLPAWRLSNFSSCDAPVLTPHLHCQCLSFELAVLKIQHDWLDHDGSWRMMKAYLRGVSSATPHHLSPIKTVNSTSLNWNLFHLKGLVGGLKGMLFWHCSLVSRRAE